MTLSPKMLAVLKKADAANAEYFAGLRETVRREADARAKTLEKQSASLRLARAVQARSAKKKQDAKRTGASARKAKVRAKKKAKS